MKTLYCLLALSLAACSGSDITSPAHYATTIVSVGSSFSCGMKAGVVKCWGAGAVGQLGNGANSDSLTPVSPLTLPSVVTGLATGSQHACVITRGGVRCWGDNSVGQLGLASGANYNTPQLHPSFGIGQTVAFLAAGLQYTCAINGQTINTTAGSAGKGTFGGNVSCWGQQQFGELGNGATGAATTPTPFAAVSALPTTLLYNISIGDQHGCASVNGGVYCWGSDIAGELENEAAVAAGSGTAVAATSLPQGGSVQMVAAGLKHSCAVVGTGVKCWGDNTYGQLGNNSNVASLKPVDVQGLSGNATAVYAGGNSSCAVADGTLQCWGYNGSGQLGDGSTANHSTAVSTGLSGTSFWVSVATTGHSCAAVDDTIYCWGGNGNGQLGNGSTSPTQTPTAVSF